ncbi:MAG TPA: M28 family peptidase [Solirubrobacteraceae bacterium]
MLNGRLYRAAFVPFLLALAVAAFSLGARPQPLSSTLAPDAFEGAGAFAELQSLAAEIPDRRPGSAGDDRLAAHVAHTLEGLGAAGHGGFQVRTDRFTAQTIDGERTLETVIAQRAGASGGTPIVILAHRDASARGAPAELSGTAALLELARVFAARETQRTIVLVSTSGGSGGAGGAADFLAHDAGPSARFDAAIVLGDLAGVSARRPFVVPYSDGFGSSSLLLQRTVAGAIAQEVGTDAGAPSAIAQVAHLAFPFAVGEQGALNAGGVPSVLVQVSGERGPSPREGVSAARLEGFGRAVLSAVDALDTAPDIAAAAQTGVVIAPQMIPEWALRLLLAALLIPPLLVTADGYARLRRRRGASGDRSIRRGLLWTVTCALPFFLAAVFARVLGWLDVLHAAPALPVPASALPLDAAAVRTVLAVALVLGLCWLAWPVAIRRLGLSVRPEAEAAGMAMLVVLLGVGVVAWALNPYAALLVLPALHLWLLLADPDRLAIGQRPRPSVALGLVALALVPLALLLVFYARELGVGPGGIAWAAVLALAGGHVGLAAAALWSVACGCVVAATLVALTTAAPAAGAGVDDGAPPVTIRGPLSYAGPGSLGGTKSALRR